MASGTGKYKYATNRGNIFYCRTDDSPDLASIRGTEPVGNTTESITFEFSKSSRSVGCKPRFCTLKLKTATSTAGCLIAPNDVTKKVIVLKPDWALPVQGTEINVNGRIWIVSGVSGEQMR